MKPLAACVFALLCVACMPPTQESVAFNKCYAAEEARERLEACSEVIAAAQLPARSRSRAHSSRGFAYEELGMEDEAFADFAAAIRLAPEDPDGYRSRADALQRAGRYEASLADITAALRLAPRDASLLNDSCWVRALLNRDLEQAAAYCEQALEQSRGNGNIWDSLALVRFKQGRFNEAYHHYDVAVRSDTEHAHYLYGRGVSALRIGKEANGRADIAAALEMDADMGATYAGYGVTP